MTRRAHAVLRSAGLLTGSAALVLCVGCTSEDEPPTADPAATESADASATTDPGVTTEEGDSVVTTYAGVPPEYPLDEVPLPDEDDVVSGSVSEYDGLTGYTITVESDQPQREALLVAQEVLVEAGLEGDTEPPAEGEESTPLTFTDGSQDLFVVLSAIRRETASLVTYTVEVS